ncbi:maltose/maltodextrin import ATP-binding protein MalK [Spirochaetota bacterium]|nr:maltose/maltodextrin import ATP-binding protein MalK [Spirochaetota bacterium]
MAKLTLKNIAKHFGRTRIIEGFNLDIESEEFIVLVGPSGCGKSTLLRMIAGLEDVTAGEIAIDNERVNERDPAGREIAMVFQSYALYPHMNAYENMAFSLKMEKKLNHDEIDARVKEAAAILRLEHVLMQKPKELSGGQKQRVAIGRAFVRKPKIFLFDEPLSNLDAKLRVEMRLEIAKLRESVAATMIYVTHDQVEAMTLADRIVVLKNGNIEQTGTPSELYLHPDNEFVAGFIGSPKMNFYPATLNDINVLNDGSAEYVICFKNLAASETERDHYRKITVTAARRKSLKLNLDDIGALKGTEIKVGCRPENITATQSTAPATDKEDPTHLLETMDSPLLFTSKIDVIEYLGNLSYLYMKNPFLTTELATMVVNIDNRQLFKKHEQITLHIPLKYMHLFRPNGAALN